MLPFTVVLNSQAKNAELTNKEHACKGGISAMKAQQEVVSRPKDKTFDQEPVCRRIILNE